MATLANVEKVFDIESTQTEIGELEIAASAPNLWDDQANAQKVTSRLSFLQGELRRMTELRSRADDLPVLFELAEAENDQSAQDEALAFRDGDRVAGIQQVEGMRRFEHLLVSGQRQACGQEFAALFFLVIKRREELIHIGVLEVIRRLLALVLQVDIAVADFAAVRRDGPYQVVNAIDVLQVHGDTLKPIGQLAGDGVALDAARLLEVGELSHFHAVEPYFPTQTPSP